VLVLVLVEDQALAGACSRWAATLAVTLLGLGITLRGLVS
jgi:hypothetical protein